MGLLLPCQLLPNTEAELFLKRQHVAQNFSSISEPPSLGGLVLTPLHPSKPAVSLGAQQKRLHELIDGKVKLHLRLALAGHLLPKVKTMLFLKRQHVAQNFAGTSEIPSLDGLITDPFQPPGHATHHTGLHQHANNVHDNTSACVPVVHCLPQLLKALHHHASSAPEQTPDHGHVFPSSSRVIMRPSHERCARQLLSACVELGDQAQGDLVANAAVFERFVAPCADHLVRKEAPEEAVPPRVVLRPRAHLPGPERRPQAPQARDRPPSRRAVQRAPHGAGDGRRLLHPGAAQREHVALAVKGARVPRLPGPVVEDSVQVPDCDLEQQPEDALQHRAGPLPLRLVPPRVVVVPRRVPRTAAVRDALEHLHENLDIALFQVDLAGHGDLSHACRCGDALRPAAPPLARAASARPSRPRGPPLALTRPGDTAETATAVTPVPVSRPKRPHVSASVTV